MAQQWGALQSKVFAKISLKQPLTLIRDCFCSLLLPFITAKNVRQAALLASIIIFARVVCPIGLREVIVSVIQPVPYVILQIVLQKLANFVRMTVSLATTKRTVFHVIRLTTTESYSPLLSAASHFRATTIISLQIARCVRLSVRCASTPLSALPVSPATISAFGAVVRPYVSLDPSLSWVQALWPVKNVPMTALTVIFTGHVLLAALMLLGISIV